MYCHAGRLLYTVAEIFSTDVLPLFIEKIPPIEPSSRVYVVHGRDERIRIDIFSFLRAIGLDPIEWTEAVRMTGKGSPFVGEILDTAFANAQAIVVVMTPDDEAKLRDQYISEGDPQYEKTLTPPARPNVLFEAGLAFGRAP